MENEKENMVLMNMMIGHTMKTLLQIMHTKLKQNDTLTKKQSVPVQSPLTGAGLAK